MRWKCVPAGESAVLRRLKGSDPIFLPVAGGAHVDDLPEVAPAGM